MADLYSLQVVCCDPLAEDQEIIGGLSWYSQQERDAALADVPEGSEPDGRPQYIVDVLDANDDIVDDRMVTASTALSLLRGRRPAPVSSESEAQQHD